MQVVLNSKRLMTTYCEWADNGTTTSEGDFKLEVFDVIFAQKIMRRWMDLFAVLELFILQLKNFIEILKNLINKLYKLI